MSLSKPNILVVEDETKVALFLKKGLETQSYSVTVAADGREGKRLIGTEHFDLVILDVNLPVLSGVELAQYIRTRNTQLPILMLTALDSTTDKLMGFEAGADDYLVKPFDFLELLARIRALLRRATPPDESEAVLKMADLELDLREKVARRMGQSIDLTAREFSLLEYLMRNQGRVVSRVDIASQVWDLNFDTGTNVIDVYINYLRNKIDKDAPVKLIHTVIGLGYVLKQK
ncbi:response regulator [Spirosoma sordidisoli]|uniref:Response regulator transcription factor n=1 Tax=Spirosoma sordidisoli TaxID=2502893 RepID=A0A4Q2UGU9_9BACT|nr:response regulator transcription factor [Spirosoma sordidisoli]RYC68603.1 response regulator transcription factor [Spirosoma sordidisoli]